ncbi:hypothetical protein GE09DRAFT_1188191 [Coniochaeta sp. 2T2.1]|nr:hypothetical protein GE09DRAFT_1188191 [Coniochaeta sp. 2T2.1]
MSAHRPNVRNRNRLLRYYPLLKGMPELQTMDFFQGREGRLVVIITGTTKGRGAGFLSQDNRLNVMFTRQKSALLIVGDKEVTGVLEGTRKQPREADNWDDADDEYVNDFDRELQDLLDLSAN